MHPLPHRYRAQARASTDSLVTVGSEGLPEMDTNPPPEFGGPPGYWSPETLLLAAVADCFVLSFRHCARASRLPWLSVTVDVEGVLDQPAEGRMQFTRFTVAPRLTIPPGTSETLARGVLHHAKRMCLIANSLSGETELATTVQIAATDEAAAAT